MSDLPLHDVATQVLQEHSLTEIILTAERVVDTREQEFAGEEGT